MKTSNLPLNESDRRRHRRFPIGLPVRLRVEGTRGATTVALRDISESGCFLSLPDDGFDLDDAQNVAVGFVLPEKNIGLARGRIVRREDGVGVGVEIEAANERYYQFVSSLTEPVARAA